MQYLLPCPAYKSHAPEYTQANRDTVAQAVKSLRGDFHQHDIAFLAHRLAERCDGIASLPAPKRVDAQPLTIKARPSVLGD
jgi:hypothetical protein